jgi:hypothetical protein
MANYQSHQEYIGYENLSIEYQDFNGNGKLISSINELVLENIVKRTYQDFIGNDKVSIEHHW